MLKLINDELIPFKETFTHNEQRENIFYQKNSRVDHIKARDDKTGISFYLTNLRFVDNGQAIKKFVIFR